MPPMDENLRFYKHTQRVFYLNLSIILPRVKTIGFLAGLYAEIVNTPPTKFKD
jgi:hypothetical protein